MEEVANCRCLVVAFTSYLDRIGPININAEIHVAVKKFAKLARLSLISAYSVAKFNLQLIAPGSIQLGWS